LLEAGNPMKRQQLIAAIEAFRQYDAEMPAQMMLTFLLVAEEPGILMEQLGEKLRIVSSSVTRNVYSLSREKGAGMPGHDLVYIEAYSKNRRKNCVYLTKKGERFASNIDSLTKQYSS
jgi:DNA-binding MarR family transcriptional regulator